MCLILLDRSLQKYRDHTQNHAISIAVLASGSTCDQCLSLKVTNVWLVYGMQHSGCDIASMLSCIHMSCYIPYFGACSH